MLVNPDAMRKAQAEIDTIIGPERLPTLSDRDQLPYVQALFLETVRWQPITPLAVHSLMKDDVYEGYYMPKGSIVIANQWCAPGFPVLAARALMRFCLQGHAARREHLQ